MKNSLFLLFLLTTMFMTFAQNDTINKEETIFLDYSKSFKIDAKLTERKIEPSDENSDFSYLFKKKQKPLDLSYKFDLDKYITQKKKPTNDFRIEEKELDSDIKVVKHFDGKDLTDTHLKTTQNLGTIESNTKFVRIEYRDFATVDGDRVKVFLNEKEIAANVHLDGLYYTLHINLEKKGYNRIDIQAINQGLYGPNTAEFVVFDDKGNVIAHKTWNLKKNDIATLGIVKH
jgi:hypothetical protein